MSKISVALLVAAVVSVCHGLAVTNEFRKTLLRIQEKCEVDFMKMVQAMTTSQQKLAPSLVHSSDDNLNELIRIAMERIYNFYDTLEKVDVSNQRQSEELPKVVDFETAMDECRDIVIEGNQVVEMLSFYINLNETLVAYNVD